MVPWVEKYRPTNISEMGFNNALLSQLETLDVSTMSHLLLSGQPGTGKTSTAIILARILLKDPRATIELNASDNRGIGIIYDLTQKFNRLQFSEENNNKIIILDEADNITKKAQQQIVNMMENYPKVKIIFTCNDPTEMIESLQSRCILLRFAQHSNTYLKDQLSVILNKEMMSITDDALDWVIFQGKNDIRTCMNQLEGITTMARYEKLSEITVDFVSDNFHKSTEQKCIELNNMLYVQDLDSCIEFYWDLEREGHSVQDIISTFIFIYWNEQDKPTITGLTRDIVYSILLHCSEIQFHMVETYDNPIYLVELLVEIYKLVRPI